MIWVVDHLADLEADFLRFYRIEDFFELDGPRFFRLASRVFAFGGVMAARLEEEREKQQKMAVDQRSVTTTESVIYESGAEVSKVATSERSYIQDLIVDGTEE